jgi:Ca-activated chloride channel family protein
MKLLYLLLSLTIFSHSTFAQSTTIYGKITDAETGEDLIYVNVSLTKNGSFKAGASTDFEGNYSIPVDPGTYDITASYIGYPNQTIEGIRVKAGQATKLDIRMTQGINLETVVVTSYKIPLVTQDNTTQGGTVTSASIRHLPKKNINGLAATSAGLSTTNRNQTILRGSRSNTNDYYIDGVRVRGSNSPLSAEERFMRGQPNILGGTPAMFEGSAAGENEAENSVEPIIINEDPIYAQEAYEDIVENDFLDVRENEFSTFSIDVDNAGYSNVRRYINYHQTPPRSAIRIEEMINYFEYDYPQPKAEHPFSINTEVGDCPWNKNNKLLHIGLQGEHLKLESASSNNLVFLIDVSGSMGSQNKLPLLKKSFSLLINQLRPEDQVAIVVYAGAAGLILPSTPVSQKGIILEALNRLHSGGSTAGGAGIHLAYKTAIDHFMADGNNRVILATDGDFNVGASSADHLQALIEEKRHSGVYLSVLGFGMGNLKDHQLETLADKGNGHYAYIDNYKEAQKVFETELTSTLYTIAKDVKLQLVFNAEYVAAYRLIGYENRLLAKEDFDDDTKDAGELGAGHTVTAIYELVLKTIDKEADLMDVKFRYKRPKEDQSRFLKHTVLNDSKSIEATSDNFRFSAAVAAFGMILKGSKYLGNADCRMVVELAEDATKADPHGYRKEFLALVEKYDTMTMTSSK